MRTVVVLDVGKTMTKLTLWSIGGELLAREVRSNEDVSGAGYAALDVIIGDAFRLGATVGSESQ